MDQSITGKDLVEQFGVLPQLPKWPRSEIGPEIQSRVLPDRIGSKNAAIEHEFLL